jgi:Lrp/AsnC family leucine-responsive transcriptional regulator
MNDHIDEKNSAILDVLEQHAEYTTRQISKDTGFPATTIHNRIQKMRKSGLIQKYTIIPDYPRTDQGLLAYVLINVNLRELKAKKISQDSVVKGLLKLEWVKRADIASGGTDIIATVRCATITEYNNVLLKKIQRIDGIDNTQSLIIIKEGAK